MRKITLLLFSVFLSVIAYGQNYAIAGGDFENWTTFTDNLNSYGLKSYATQGVGKGYNGSNSLNIAGTTTANDYVFTAFAPSSFPSGSITAITFMVKGTSDAKSLSVNLYKDASNYYKFNVGALSSSDVTISSSASNSYTGTINTDGKWVKVTLDLTGITDFNRTAGVNFLALKTGSSSTYALDIDNIEFVVSAAGTKTLNATPTSLDFSINMGNSTDPKTVSIVGSNLTSVPTYSVSGTDAAMFTVTGTLTTAGGTLSVVFTPTSEGSKSASLDVVSETASVSIPLTGTATASNVETQTFTFKSGLEPWTQVSVTGDQLWVSDSSYGAKMSGYSGGNVVNEDWLISPSLDLSGGVESAWLTFDQAINYAEVVDFPVNHTLWISSNYTSGAPSTATWTQLTIPTYPASKGWTFVNSGTVAAPSQFIGQANVSIAFKYISTADVASTWEITNLILSRQMSSSGVDNISENSLNVYGGNGKVKFEATAGNNVEIYSTTGQRIYKGKTIDGQNSINVNVKGLLIVKVANRIGKVVL